MHKRNQDRTILGKFWTVLTAGMLESSKFPIRLRFGLPVRTERELVYMRKAAASRLGG
jgi:hypothetical protein